MGNYLPPNVSQLDDEDREDPLAGLTIENTECWRDGEGNLDTFVLNCTNGDRYSIEVEDGIMTIGHEGNRLNRT
jgi:hypothetical protein